MIKGHSVPFWPNIELVRDVLDVFLTSKNQEDPIIDEGT